MKSFMFFPLINPSLAARISRLPGIGTRLEQRVQQDAHTHYPDTDYDSDIALAVRHEQATP